MTVLQPWLETIPIRMQSTLLLSLRGPDTHRCPETKKIQRWLRGLAFRPGNPDNVKEFMAPMSSVPLLVEKGPLARELEFTTQHFYSHLMHGLEVVGYCHPDQATAKFARDLFANMCALFHLLVETKDEFSSRLGTRTDWPGGVQPVDFIAAIEEEEPKPEPTRHYCGLQGFNPMLGDECPACDEYKKEQKQSIIAAIKEEEPNEG